MSYNIYENGQLKRISGNSIMDAALDANSTNGVQNKVVTEAITQLNNDLAKSIKLVYCKSTNQAQTFTLSNVPSTCYLVVVVGSSGSYLAAVSMRNVPEGYFIQNITNNYSESLSINGYVLSFNPGVYRMLVIFKLCDSNTHA